MARKFRASESQLDFEEDDRRFFDVNVLNSVMSRYASESGNHAPPNLIIVKSDVCNAVAAVFKQHTAIFVSTGIIDYIHNFCTAVCRTTNIVRYMEGDFSGPTSRTIVGPVARRLFILEMCAPNFIRGFTEEGDRIEGAVASYFEKFHYSDSNAAPDDFAENVQQMKIYCLAYLIYDELAHIHLVHHAISNKVSQMHLLSIFENAESRSKYQQVMEIEADNFAFKQLLMFAWCQVDVAKTSSKTRFRAVFSRCLMAKYFVFTLLLALVADDEPYAEGSASTHPHALIRHHVSNSQIYHFFDYVYRHVPHDQKLTREDITSLIHHDLAFFSTEYAFRGFESEHITNEQWTMTREAADQALPDIAAVSQQIEELRRQVLHGAA
jgi:hypothetical protein